MSSSNVVYKLDAIYDVPEYEHFAYHESVDSVLGNHSIESDFFLKNNLEPIYLKEKWKDPRVIGNVRPWNDSAGHMHRHIFSLRAVIALRDLLEPNGEILPLESDVSDYFAYNVTTVADVLDTEKSVINWGLDYLHMSKVRRHVFYPDRLDSLSIFRVPKDSLSVYVTDIFADRIREHQLEGFALMKVWPLVDGEDWWELRRAKLRYWEDKAKRLRKTKSPDEPLLETWRDI